ncbi:unnamed protein product [Protopolystoma xenopodis]|uniref:Uncharacterized protein n=1 Tax=Protopolystoma xenopodis TaxID=117903 RepID=A0A448WED2_9PLAT|nr:unnamed protein product [Protopolystoma xenopodis]
MALLTDYVSETFGNVPSQWSNTGNHEYYGRGHGIKNQNVASVTNKTTPEAPSRSLEALRNAVSAATTSSRVELLREPLGPTEEDAVGFAPDWRESLRLSLTEDPRPSEQDKTESPLLSDPAILLASEVMPIHDSTLLALDNAIVSAQIAST